MSSINVQHSCNEVSTVVKWKIENFNTQLPKEKQTVLESDDFCLYKSRLSFYLRFRTISLKDECKDSCSLYLVPKNLDSEKKLKMKWKFWMENEDGKKIGNQTRFNYKFDTENIGWGKPAFVKHTELYPPESNFIKNGVAFICCEIVQNTSQQCFKPIPLNDTEVMRNFYKSSKSENRNGKLTIHMKNKTFKVNKALLSFRSSVFQQMLQDEKFEEAKNNLIKIEDFEPEVMESFIEFMHLEYVSEENVKHAHELLKLADKYNVIKLKEECTQILTKSLNKDNVFPILITCFMHDCPKLKKNVLNYLCRNGSDSSFREIMKTREWKEFALENEAVSDEIIDAVFDKVKSFEDDGTDSSSSESSSSDD